MACCTNIVNHLAICKKEQKRKGRTRSSDTHACISRHTPLHTPLYVPLHAPLHNSSEPPTTATTTATAATTTTTTTTLELNAGCHWSLLTPELPELPLTACKIKLASDASRGRCRDKHG